MSATIYDAVGKTKRDFTISRRDDSRNKGETSVRKCYRMSIGCLGIACILQTAAIIVLCVQYTADKQHLQNSINNLLVEKEWLEMSKESLILDKNILQQENEWLHEKIAQLGWKYFNHSIYHVSVGKKSWTESRQNCRHRGADLVIINSKEEQIFMSQRLRDDIWIGLTDAETEGVWKWVDNTLQSLGYWMPDQPNNYNGNQNCAFIQHSDLSSLETWNDYQCTSEKYYVCEK